MTEEEDTTWLKLLTFEKCTHKLWKARVDGYEKAYKIFNVADADDPEFKKYSSIIKDFVSETNPSALDKGLDACLSFMTNYTLATKVAGGVCDGLIKKCLTGKPKAREKATNIFLMIIEIEQTSVVLKKLNECLEVKQPKIVSAAIETIIELIRCFGVSVVDIKPYLKRIDKLIDNRDKAVREGIKSLVIECHRWIGSQAIKPLISNLKPIIISEFEKEFDKSSSSKAKPTRLLRSQQLIVDNNEEVSDQEDDDSVGDDDIEVIDTYELLPSFDLLCKIPKNFYSEMESTAWKDRQAALQILVDLLKDVQKLEVKADYSELFSFLRKVMAKEKNVAISILCATCLTCIANSLRKNLNSHAIDVITSTLLRLKDKKMNVVSVMRACNDAHQKHVMFEGLSFVLIESLASKVPTIRCETLKFCIQIFLITPLSQYNKKLIKEICAPIIKMISDSLSEIRDLSMEAIGVLMKVHGEPAIKKYLDDIDKIKLTKILKFSEKAELNIKGISNKSKASKKSNDVPSPKKTKKEKPVVEEKKIVKKKKVGTKQTAVKKNDSPKKKLTKKVVNEPTEKEMPTEIELGAESAIDLVNEFLKDDINSKLISTQWKIRLELYEALSSRLNSISDDMDVKLPAMAILVVMLQKPGFKDSNVKVLKEKFDVLSIVAKKAKITKTLVNLSIPVLIEKIFDLKLKNIILVILDSFSERLRLKYICELLIEQGGSHKNAKVQTEILNWMVIATDAFGAKKMDLKILIPFIKMNLSSKTPAPRKAAITLLSKLNQHLGSMVRNLFADQSSTVLTAVDSEIENIKDNPIPEPTLGVKVASKKIKKSDDTPEAVESSDSSIVEIDEYENQLKLDDSIPRTNISDLLTEEIFNQVNDSSWKIRTEGLKAISDILAKIKYIENDIPLLIPSLKSRIRDNNKIIISTSLEIIKNLASAIGCNFKVHVNDLWRDVLHCLSDSKIAVRTKALDAMNEILLQCRLPQLITDEIVVDALTKGNPLIKENLLCWLAKTFSDYKGKVKVPSCDMKPLINISYNLLFDQNVKVRKQANDAIKYFQYHINFAFMNKLADSHKESKAIITIIANHKTTLEEEVAAKPKEVKKEKMASRSKTDVDENVESDGATKNVQEDRFSTITKRKYKKQTNSLESVKTKLDPKISINPSSSSTKQTRASNKTLASRWNALSPTEPSKEYLNEHIEQNFGETIATYMKSSDFSLHIKALSSLKEQVLISSATTYQVTDLILKWISLRCLDTNTTIILKCFEYLEILVSIMLKENKITLSDIETNCLVPVLLTKIGDSKEAIRKKVRDIIIDIVGLHPYVRIFSYLIDALTTRNSRQRIECLEMIHKLNSDYPDIIQTSNSEVSSIKIIAAQLSDRDNNVRMAAIKTLVSLYGIHGTMIYKMIGDISKNNRELLEDRFRKSIKTTQDNTQKPVKNASNLRNLSSYPEMDAVSETEIHNVTRSITPSSSIHSIDSPKEENVRFKRQETIELVPEDEKAYVSLLPRVEDPFLNLNNHKIPDLDEILMGEDQKTQILNLINWKVSELPKAAEEIIDHKESTINIDSDIKSLNSTKIISSTSTNEDVDTLTQDSSKLSQKIEKRSDPLILYIIQSVRNVNNTQSLYAFKRIELMLKDPSQVAKLSSEHVDLFLISCAKKIQHVNSCISNEEKEVRNLSMSESSVVSCDLKSDMSNFSTASTDDLKNTSKVTLIENVYNYMVLTILKIFQNDTLGQSASSNGLYALMHSLISTITCDTLIKHPEIKVDIPSLSSLIGRCICMSNQTNVLYALILLLAEAITKSFSDNFIDLNMKCIWRILKKMDRIIGQIDIEKIFVAVTKFFVICRNIVKAENNSVSSPHDKQIRTIKTVIFTVIKSLHTMDKGYYTKKLDSLKNNTHDPTIRKMINKSLKGLQEKNYATALENNPELKEIVNLLKSPGKKFMAIHKLYEIKQRDLNFDPEVILIHHTKDERSSILGAINKIDGGKSHESTLKKENVTTNGEYDIQLDDENNSNEISNCILNSRSRLDKLKEMLYTKNLLNRPAISHNTTTTNIENNIGFNSELSMPLNTPRDQTLPDNKTLNIQNDTTTIITQQTKKTEPQTKNNQQMLASLYERLRRIQNSN